MLVIYTVRDGRHPLEDFLRLLGLHRVEALVHVRSQPYSRWAPQFKREAMTPALSAVGITYHYPGDSLGGRPSDAGLYPSGASGRPGE